MYPVPDAARNHMRRVLQRSFCVQHQRFALLMPFAGQQERSKAALLRRVTLLAYWHQP
jgi:hypothetical protein